MRSVGKSAPFVDPSLAALDAPVCWLPATGVATLTASTERAPNIAEADLALERLSCVQHIVGGPDRMQKLLVHATDLAVTLELRGDLITDAPINLTFHVHRLTHAKAAGSLLIKLSQVLGRTPRRIVRSVRHSLMRNALIALDGRHAGASYRDMAIVAFGSKRANAAWNSTSRAIKDHIIRAADKGDALVDGGYRRLIR